MRSAPHTMPVRRLDDVRAARHLDLTWTPTTQPLDRYKPRGATRVVRALGASLRGLAGAFRDEAAFRQELAFAAVVIPLGLWLGTAASSARCSRLRCCSS